MACTNQGKGETPATITTLRSTAVEPQSPPAARVESSENHPHTFSSDQLLQGRKAVMIEHHGAIYRLQQTKQGKLILTK